MDYMNKHFILLFGNLLPLIISCFVVHCFHKCHTFSVLSSVTWNKQLACIWPPTQRVGTESFFWSATFIFVNNAWEFSQHLEDNFFFWGSNLSCEKEAFKYIHKHLRRMTRFSMNERVNEKNGKLFQGHNDKKMAIFARHLFSRSPKRHSEHLRNISRFFFFISHFMIEQLLCATFS